MIRNAIRSLAAHAANPRVRFKAFLLALTFFSAVAFTAANFLARLFSPQSLPSLIQFQSTSVFLAFIVQAGLRAGLRNQHHLGRRRLVVATERRVLKAAAWAGLPVAGVALFQNRFEVFPAFAILQAELTLLVGLRIAQGKLDSSAKWSVLTFLTILAAALTIMFSHLPTIAVRIIVETGSVLALYGISLRAGPVRMSNRALKFVLFSCIGLQIGSFSVYLLDFAFRQYVVFLAKGDLSVGIAYADIQMICGVQSLLLSRVALLIEGGMIRRGNFRAYSLGFVAWTLLFSAAVFLVVAARRDARAALVYAILVLPMMGNISLGTIAQFMKDRFRLEFFILTFIAAAVLGGGIYFEIRGSAAGILIGALSTTSLAVVLSIRSAFARQSYFIQPAREAAASPI